DQSHRSPLAEAAALSRLRTAGFVFAGPGSPSYALSVWRSSPVPEALTTKLAEGGAVVFSSAAALTLGRFSVPVYEIYKVGLPVRRRGKSRVFPSGTRLTVDELCSAARGEAETGRRAAERPAAAADAEAPTPGSGPAPKRSPLLTEVTRLEQVFETAIAGRRASEAAEAILNLDRTIAEWAADTLQTDDPDRARAVLHSLVQRLGEAAAGGLRDPREL